MLPPLAQFPLWSNQGLDQGLPSFFQPYNSLILCRPSPIPGFRESLVKARVCLSRKQPPTCYQVLLVRSLLMQAGAQAKAGRFVVVCGARPFPRCHCSGKAIIPPRDKQGCLRLSPLSPQRLQPLAAGQPGSAPGSRHLPCVARCIQGSGWGGARQDWGEGCWGHGPPVRSKLPGTEEKGKGPRIPSSSGSGPRSSLQMAQGFSPRPPAMGQPACTWHCGSGCCQRTVSSSQLRKVGAQ